MNREVTPKKDWQTGDRAVYAAMVESLDTNVGRIVDAIDARGLGENTLIVFTSDNGGDVHARNAPLAGGKGKLSEGGIRSPCIARWTGRLPAGKQELFDLAADVGEARNLCDVHADIAKDLCRQRSFNRCGQRPARGATTGDPPCGHVV